MYIVLVILVNFTMIATFLSVIYVTPIGMGSVVMIHFNVMNIIHANSMISAEYC